MFFVIIGRAWPSWTSWRYRTTWYSCCEFRYIYYIEHYCLISLYNIHINYYVFQMLPPGFIDPKTAPHLLGVKGERGDPGIPGLPGPIGPSVSINFASICDCFEGEFLKLLCKAKSDIDLYDKIFVFFDIFQGDMGHPGIQGPKGDTGSMGAPGAKGHPGVTGYPGEPVSS